MEWARLPYTTSYCTEPLTAGQDYLVLKVIVHLSHDIASLITGKCSWCVRTVLHFGVSGEAWWGRAFENATTAVSNLIAGSAQRRRAVTLSVVALLPSVVKSDTSTLTLCDTHTSRKEHSAVTSVVNNTKVLSSGKKSIPHSCEVYDPGSQDLGC